MEKHQRSTGILLILSIHLFVQSSTAYPKTTNDASKTLEPLRPSEINNIVLEELVISGQGNKTRIEATAIAEDPAKINDQILASFVNDADPNSAPCNKSKRDQNARRSRTIIVDVNDAKELENLGQVLAVSEYEPQKIDRTKNKRKIADIDLLHTDLPPTVPDRFSDSTTSRFEKLYHEIPRYSRSRSVNLGKRLDAVTATSVDVNPTSKSTASPTTTIRTRGRWKIDPTSTSAPESSKIVTDPFEKSELQKYTVPTRTRSQRPRGFTSVTSNPNTGFSLLRGSRNEKTHTEADVESIEATTVSSTSRLPIRQKKVNVSKEAPFFGVSPSYRDDRLMSRSRKDDQKVERSPVEPATKDVVSVQNKHHRIHSLKAPTFYDQFQVKDADASDRYASFGSLSKYDTVPRPFGYSFENNAAAPRPAEKYLDRLTANNPTEYSEKLPSNNPVATNLGTPQSYGDDYGDIVAESKSGKQEPLWQRTANPTLPYTPPIRERSHVKSLQLPYATSDATQELPLAELDKSVLGHNGNYKGISTARSSTDKRRFDVDSAVLHSTDFPPTIARETFDRSGRITNKTPISTFDAYHGFSDSEDPVLKTTVAEKTADSGDAQERKGANKGFVSLKSDSNTEEIDKTYPRPNSIFISKDPRRSTEIEIDPASSMIKKLFHQPVDNEAALTELDRNEFHKTKDESSQIEDGDVSTRSLDNEQKNSEKYEANPSKHEISARLDEDEEPPRRYTDHELAREAKSLEVDDHEDDTQDDRSREVIDQERRHSHAQNHHEYRVKEDAEEKQESKGDGGKGDGGKAMGDYKFEKGVDEKYDQDRAEVHGEKGQKSYKSRHEHDESEKGHHDKERHDNNYKDDHGEKKEHEEKGGYHEERQEAEEGEKTAEFDEKGEHKKGHSTKGEHNVHKKDEYEKKTEFFEEFHEDGDAAKDGEFYQEHEAEKGGHEKSGRLEDVEHAEKHGKKENHEKGGYSNSDKGHKGDEGDESHHEGRVKTGKKEGSATGKKWMFKRSDDGASKGNR